MASPWTVPGRPSSPRDDCCGRSGTPTRSRGRGNAAPGCRVFSVRCRAWWSSGAGAPRAAGGARARLSLRRSGAPRRGQRRRRAARDRHVRPFGGVCLRRLGDLALITAHAGGGDRRRPHPGRADPRRLGELLSTAEEHDGAVGRTRGGGLRVGRGRRRRPGRLAASRTCAAPGRSRRSASPMAATARRRSRRAARRCGAGPHRVHRGDILARSSVAEYAYEGWGRPSNGAA